MTDPSLRPKPYRQHYVRRVCCCTALFSYCHIVPRIKTEGSGLGWGQIRFQGDTPKLSTSIFDRHLRCVCAVSFIPCTLLHATLQSYYYYGEPSLIGPVVQTKTYTLPHLYQQYLVLFTMVPRINSLNTK